MGQKVSPLGMRLGFNRTWDSRWFAKSDYASILAEDLKIRDYLNSALKKCGVAKILLERPTGRLLISIWTAKPAYVIGRKGALMATLNKDISKIVSREFSIKVLEVSHPDLIARVVADNVANQISSSSSSYRKLMKKTVQSIMRAGAKGVALRCSGRLAGVEIARSESIKEGQLPLSTLRADLDYAKATAHTSYGAIGVSVWIYRGECLERNPMLEDEVVLSSSVKKG